MFFFSLGLYLLKLENCFFIRVIARIFLICSFEIRLPLHG